jgi:hypothetical protein
VADERVNFKITAQDMATARLRNLKGELQALGGTAGGLARPMQRLSDITGGFITPTTVAFGAAAALGGAFIGAAKAAMEEERGIAALTAALKANDPAAVANIEQIEETIRQRQNLAFADDEQRESLAALIGVTRDSKKALDLQRIAMDLARLKGIDLATATGIIGKVSAGNLGILSRYGIVLEEGATATEALAEIQRRSAGQAEEYANTTSGSMESLSMVFGDVVEDIGGALLPVMKDLALFARDELVPAIKEVVNVLKNLGNEDSAAGIPVIEQIEDSLNGLAKASFDAGRWVRENVLGIAPDVEDGLREIPRVYAAVLPEVQRAAETLAQIPVQAIQRRWVSVRAAAFETVVQYQLGILDGQNRLKVAMEALTRLQAEEQTKAQRISYLQGLLSSQQLTAGLNDGRPGVSGAARAIVAQTTAELAALGVNAYRYGVNAGNELAAGLNSRYGVVRNAAGSLAQAISGQIGIRSEPDDSDSPLRGITKFGGNIVDEMAGGIQRRLGSAHAAAGALAGALVPSLGPAVPAFSAMGGMVGSGVSAAGHPLQIQVVMPDGRVLAEVVTREQYYMHPAGASVLPRGT